MATGTTTVDFGGFPGKSDASVTITGQASIVAGSLVEAWLRPVATADHTADEHMIETLKVVAGNIVAGTGFTIYAFNTSELHEQPIDPAEAAHAAGGQFRDRLGPSNQRVTVPQNYRQGTRIYGQWTVAWAWV